MHWSQTWQQLDPWILEPLMQGVITVAEASEMFDHVLMQTGPLRELPPSLWPAAQRLHLWASKPQGMVQ